MRYGKPIKNKNRVDPRYFLNERAYPERVYLPPNQGRAVAGMFPQVVMPDGKIHTLQYKNRNDRRTKAAIALWQLRNPNLRFVWDVDKSGIMKPYRWAPRPGDDFGAEEAKEEVYDQGLAVLVGVHKRILDQILGGHFEFKPEKLEDYGIQAPPPTERPPKAQSPADPGRPKETQGINPEGWKVRCKSGYVWDESQGNCVPGDSKAGDTPSCAEGYVWDASQGDCVPTEGFVSGDAPAGDEGGTEQTTAPSPAPAPAADTAETNEEKLKRLLRDRGVNLDYVRLKGKRLRPMIPRGTHALLKKAKKLEKRGGDKWDKFKQSEKYLKAKNSWQARGVWNKFKKLSKGYYSKTKRKAPPVTPAKAPVSPSEDERASKVAREKGYKPGTKDYERSKAVTLRKGFLPGTDQRVIDQFKKKPAPTPVAKTKKPTVTPVPAPTS